MLPPKMNKILFALFFCLCCITLSHAQVGGRRSFDFLNMPTHARLWALGGANVSAQNKDPHLFVSNPSLLNDSISNNHLAINVLNYVADISQTNLAFAFKTAKTGLWGLSMQYLNYGKIQGYDLTGAATNAFQNREWALGISRSLSSQTYRMGATLKIAGSNIGQQNASGLFMDIGGAFVHPAHDLIVGISFRNIGFLFNNYLPTSTYTMPFEAQIGASYKAARMPLRFSLTAQQIGRSSTSADDPTAPRQLNNNGLPIVKEITGTQRLIRHFVVGAELILNKNLQANLAYNFLRRREMLVSQRPGTVGLSCGVNYRFRAIQLGAAWSVLHIGETGFNFSLNIDGRYLLKRSTKG